MPGGDAAGKGTISKKKDLDTAMQSPGGDKDQSADETKYKGRKSMVVSAGQKDDSADGGGKTSFMSKLKGEVKVLTGKIGLNEKKVQEEEKLVHGE